MNRTDPSRASISSLSSTSSYHSTPSINGSSNGHGAFLLSAAYQLPLSGYDGLPLSKFSSLSPNYDMSSDPISQNFDFEDIFEFDEDTFSKARLEKSQLTTSKKSNPNGNKVVATPSRNTTLLPRRPKQQQYQQRYPQVSSELDDLPEKEAVRRFSFSHYPPIPNLTTASLDSSSRRRKADAPTRTSPGAARLHEMLARGR